MTEIVPTNNGTAIQNNFMWKTAVNEMIAVKDMSTRHLFNTVMMIWNHYAPDKYRIGRYNPKMFSEFYTDEYMATAFQAMIAELWSRDDRESMQTNTMHAMKRSIVNMQESKKKISAYDAIMGLGNSQSGDIVRRLKIVEDVLRHEPKSKAWSEMPDEVWNDALDDTWNGLWCDTQDEEFD